MHLEPRKTVRFDLPTIHAKRIDFRINPSNLSDMHIISSPLSHWSERPKGSDIDTLIIHSLYAISVSDPFDVKACIQALDSNKVASHYLIDRGGEILKLVDEEKKAWHAGVSKMPFPKDGRENVNDFSIGVELIATETSGFTEEEYNSLIHLTLDITTRHSLKYILGHEHISPDRKKDPGPLFNWKKFQKSLSGAAEKILFPDSADEHGTN